MHQKGKFILTPVSERGLPSRVAEKLQRRPHLSESLVDLRHTKSHSDDVALALCRVESQTAECAAGSVTSSSGDDCTKAQQVVRTPSTGIEGAAWLAIRLVSHPLVTACNDRSIALGSDVDDAADPDIL